MERRKELRKKRDERKESGNKIGFLRRRRVFPLSPFEFFNTYLQPIGLVMCFKT